MEEEVKYKKGDLVVNKFDENGVMQIRNIDENNVYLARIGARKSMSWGIDISKIRYATTKEIERTKARHRL